MSALSSTIDRARAHPRHIVLPEGKDARIVEAGSRRAVNAALQKHAAGSAGIEIIDPDSTDRFSAYADANYDMREHKAGSRDGAMAAMRLPLDFAAMMLRQGDADGMVAGATKPTADVIRTAKRIVGLSSAEGLVSSFFLMVLDREHHERKGSFVFADCGLTVEPDAHEMAEIAVSSARSFQVLTGEVPKVCMLSFSTQGSPRHERVTKVVKATRLVRQIDPAILVDGEMQFDAAFDVMVNASKAPQSVTRGEANVFVFPSLESANIGYKIAQRIGGATAIGPILQGLAKPANDLSRGCTAEDVYNLIAVTVVQAASAGSS